MADNGLPPPPEPCLPPCCPPAAPEREGSMASSPLKQRETAWSSCEKKGDMDGEQESAKRVRVTGGEEAATAAAVPVETGGLMMVVTEEEEVETVELVAKWRGEELPLGALPLTCTVAHVKMLLQTKTRVHPTKQKLIGLSKGKTASDDTFLSALSFTTTTSRAGGSRGGGAFRFILMGTPEEEAFVDPSERDDLPEVFDDLDLDVSCLSDEWRRSVQNSDNLKKFTASTEVHLIHPPRPGKRLLVLDLDHTLLDFSQDQGGGRSSMMLPGVVGVMRRPHLDTFLSAVYQHYDLVVWSQTSWRWLEIKMVELGLLTHPHYRFCFVLDKTSMFRVETPKTDGSIHKHQVKPLQIIWSKFPQQWSAANTVHIDDLSRNFALNQGNGIKIKAYYRDQPDASQDRELLLLARYLTGLVAGGHGVDLSKKDHSRWRDEAGHTD